MWGQESLQSWKLWQRGIYLIFQGLIFSEAESECDLLLEKKKLRQKIAEMFPHSLLTHSVPLLQMYGHLGWHLNLTMPASCTQEQKENLGQGSGSLIIFNVPSYLSHSMILWCLGVSPSPMFWLHGRYTLLVWLTADMFVLRKWSPAVSFFLLNYLLFTRVLLRF